MTGHYGIRPLPWLTVQTRRGWNRTKPTLIDFREPDAQEIPKPRNKKIPIGPGFYFHPASLRSLARARPPPLLQGCAPVLQISPVISPVISPLPEYPKFQPAHRRIFQSASAPQTFVRRNRTAKTALYFKLTRRRRNCSTFSDINFVREAVTMLPESGNESSGNSRVLSRCWYRKTLPSTFPSIVRASSSTRPDISVSGYYFYI